MQASAVTSTTDQLTDQLFVLLRRLMLDPEADHLRVIEDHDLSISQVRALILLACTDPEPLPGGRIAERLNVSPAAISRALDGLVREGFVVRTESIDDRRIRPLAITDSGRALTDELRALRRAQLVRFVDTLNDEQRGALSTALSTIPMGAAE